MTQAVKNIFSFFIAAFFYLNTLAQVEFCAVGDILLDRGVRKTINENDVFYPFAQVKSIISANDIAFYNNEFPVCNKTDGFAINKKFSFRAEPDYIKGLKSAGFNIASVANNHTIDYSKSGFIKTIKLLNKNGIYTVGGGKNQKQAFKPLLLEKNGQTFAFFANLEFLLEGTSFNQNRPYPAFAQINRLCKNIKKYNSIVDFVIISFHWGRESVTTPTYKQVNFAHKVIDAGADIVIGHHPHVLQSVEIYKNKIILYSLGNFVFDNSKKLQKQSVIFKCSFNNAEIINPRFIPVSIKNHRPVIASKEQTNIIFEQLIKISEGFNSSFKKENNEILINYKHQKTLKELKYKNLNFNFFKDSIFVYNDNFFELKYKIPGKKYILKDVCMLPTDSLIYFFGIVENKKSKKTRIAIFVFSTKKYKFTKPYLDTHNFYNAWKIRILDVDNDSLPELIVGVNKSTKYFKKKENRIFVFNINGAYIYPKWLGSKIGNPVIDFKIDKINNKLILLQKFDNKKTHKVFSFKWNGFGFDLDKHLFDIDTNKNIKLHFQLSDYEFNEIN